MDTAKTSKNPDTFRALLAGAAEGVALLHPSLDASYGGTVGDCGYVKAGRFWKLFSVFDPPEGIPSLPRPQEGSLRVEICRNTGVLKSSNSSSFTLRGGLPFSCPPFEIDASLEVSQNEASFAFLAFGGGSHRLDEWSETRLLQLYLAANEDAITRTFWTTPVAECGLLLLYGTTKVNAWVGGVAHGLSTSVRARIEVTAAGVQVVDLCVGNDSTDTGGTSVTSNPNWACTQGPLEWSPADASFDYCVIVRPVTIRRRDRFMRKARTLLEVRSPSGSEYINRRIDGSSPSTQSSPSPPSSFGDAMQISPSSPETSQRSADSPPTSEPYEDEEDDTDAGAPTLLDEILDSVFEANPDVSAAVGDWSIIATYAQVHGKVPNPACHKLFDVCQFAGGDVAFLRQLLPASNNVLDAPSCAQVTRSNSPEVTSEDCAPSTRAPKSMGPFGPAAQTAPVTSRAHRALNSLHSRGPPLSCKLELLTEPGFSAFPRRPQPLTASGADVGIQPAQSYPMQLPHFGTGPALSLQFARLQTSSTPKLELTDDGGALSGPLLQDQRSHSSASSSPGLSQHLNASDTGYNTTPSRPLQSSSQQQKTFAFIDRPGNQVRKRPRRRYDDIERLYPCGWPNCNKSYGTLNHLNAHVTMQRHGEKRSPNEFKEMRKQWRKQKKEEAAIIAIHQASYPHSHVSLPRRDMNSPSSLDFPSPTEFAPLDGEGGLLPGVAALPRRMSLPNLGLSGLGLDVSPPPTPHFAASVRLPSPDLAPTSQQDLWTPQSAPPHQVSFLPEPQRLPQQRLPHDSTLLSPLQR